MAPRTAAVRLLAPLVLVLALVGSPATAAAAVPQRFVGMMLDGPLFYPKVNLSRQLDTMVATGVESLRAVFNWAAAEPYGSCSQVPAGKQKQFQCINGIPVNFRPMDRLVKLAAARELTVLPVVLGTPGWAAANIQTAGYDVPANDSTYGDFLTVLVQRYGPKGSFWTANPKLPRVPIRMWQIWNEPDLVRYWPIQPFAPTYVDLLRAAHKAVKAADRGAKIVLAGTPNRSWSNLASIYKVAGARKVFDVVAVHPFTSEPAGVITILRKDRAVMNKYGDTRKPMLATEISWPSSLHKTSQYFGFETTEAGEAHNLSAVLPMLAANRTKLHLLGFYVYSWMGVEYHNAASFNFAGLFRYTRGHIFQKPAYPAFRKAALALEGCQVKAKVATRCLQP